MSHCNGFCALTDTAQKHSFPSLRDIVAHDLAHARKAFMSFADVRDATSAFARAKGLGVDWNVQYIAAAQFVLHHQKATLSADIIYEGQILVRADLVYGDQRFEVDGVAQMVKSILCRHGELMALELGLVDRDAKIITFKAEYYHVEAAKQALCILDGHDLGVSLDASQWR